MRTFKFDWYFLFLGFSLLFLFLTFPSVSESLNVDAKYKEITWDYEDYVSIPERFNDDSQGQFVKTYSPEYSLEYSINGGQDFKRTIDNRINLNDVSNPKVMNFSTSVRWRPPGFDLPEIKALSIRLVDKNKRTITVPKDLSFIQPYSTKLPIVSIITKEDNLFDWNDGIMVLGEKSSNQKNTIVKWWEKNANYRERSHTSRRKITFQYYIDNELVVDQSCFMKIGGNATRSFPQKSMKIYPIDEFGRTIDLGYNFWNSQGNYAPTSFVLRNSGNDNTHTLFADFLMHTFAEDSKVHVLRGIPVSVFINGNYWGIYNLRERIDSEMLAELVNEKPKDITILKCEANAEKATLDEGDISELKEFESIITLCEKEVLTKKDFTFISERVSFKSFIDYIFFETFFANQDWIGNNTTWFKAKGDQWRWILNDLDLAMAYQGEANVNANIFSKLKQRKSITGTLFYALMQVSEFRGKFFDRCTKHLEEKFNEEFIDETFSFIKDLYNHDIGYQIDRWRSISGLNEWELNCKRNLDFLKNRVAVYTAQLKSL